MRVLYVTGIDSTKYGGFEKYTVELAKQPGITLSIIYNSKPTSRKYLDDLESVNVRLRIVHGNIFQRVFQVYNIIIEEKPDIIHYHFGFTVYFLSFIIKLFHPRIKQILTQHCEFAYKGKPMLFCTKLCYSVMDYVLSVSEGVRKGLIEKIGNKKHYIVHYLGVAKKNVKNPNLRNSLHISQDELVITSIGFNVKVKGFDLLIHSIYELKKETNIPKFKVIVIGLGEDENSILWKNIYYYGLENEIISVGIRNDIDDFLSFTDIYVQPSRTEAISLSIMEALLYGIPIIGANVGGIPEVCIPNKNGELFERNDYKQLKDLICKFLINSKLRKVYGENSLRLSKKYGILNSVQRLVLLYKDVFKK